MIQIPKEELLESLRDGYTEFKNCTIQGNSEVDLAHVKGFCKTIEQILAAYGGVTVEEMMEIKKPIIGEVSLRRKQNKDKDVDYSVPTIFRKQFD